MLDEKERVWDGCGKWAVKYHDDDAMKTLRDINSIPHSIRLTIDSTTSNFHERLDLQSNNNKRTKY